MAALPVTAEPPVPAPPPLQLPAPAPATTDVAMPQLVWMQQSDWRRDKKAGIAKSSVRKPKEDKVASARRKRLRRISIEKEDRDALRDVARKVARSREDLPELEATPAGLHEAAMDGTPRSARAAGAKLRKLTQSFYERLQDPRFYGVDPDKFFRVEVRCKFWNKGWMAQYDSRHDDSQLCGFGQWENGVRHLIRHGHGQGRNGGPRCKDGGMYGIYRADGDIAGGLPFLVLDGCESYVS